MTRQRSLLLAAGLLALTSVVLWRLEPVRANALVIRPYLQAVGSDRAVIAWAMTGPAATGAVELSADGNAWRHVPASTRTLPPSLTGLDHDVLFYRAEVTGLSPQSAYLYRVLSGVAPVGEDPLSFHTPGAAAVRFLVFGDSGDGSAAQSALARLLLQEKADFGLHTGDLAYQDGTFEQFRDYHFGVYAPLLARLPLFTTPGNHEYYTPGAAVYLALLAAPSAPPHHSFQWGPVHVTVIDSNAPLEQAAQGDDSLRRWLEADLASAARWRIAVFHHTPFPVSHHKGTEATDRARRILVPLLENQGVRLVLNGHEHLYMRTHPLRDGEPAADGTVYVTTGGGGAVLHPDAEPPPPFAAFSRSALHYLRITVEGRELKLEAVGENGAVFDESVLTTGLRRPRRMEAAAGSSVPIPPTPLR